MVSPITYKQIENCTQGIYDPYLTWNLARNFVGAPAHDAGLPLLIQAENAQAAVKLAAELGKLGPAVCVPTLTTGSKYLTVYVFAQDRLGVFDVLDRMNVPRWESGSPFASPAGHFTPI